MRRLIPACAALFCLAGLPSAQAGQSCIAHDVVVPELDSAITVANQIRQTLERKNTRFALIARVGNDISKHGLKYTHVGFVRKRGKDGEWIVIHQLNPCASADSGLYRQGLGTFMLDDLLTHEVMVVTLPEHLQTHLETVFADNAPHRFYDPQYSMISYPGTPAKYQNSNEWLLELLALAQAKVEGVDLSSRDEMHHYYRRKGFTGSTIRISPLRRSLAKLAARNIRFDDHPPASHRSGRYETVSVKSVVAYLQHTGDASEVITFSGPYRRSDRTAPDTEDHQNGD